MFSASTHGQSADSEIIVPDTIQLPKSFVNRLIRQPDADQRLLTALQQFERIDLDGNGITQEDLDRRHLMDAARMRSTYVQRYLAYDLNADGIVTREEMENTIIWKSSGNMSRSSNSASARLRMQQRLKKLLEPFEKGDLNRDDVLDASEVFELAKNQADTQLQKRSGRRQSSLEGSIMSLDFNSDGVVSEQEFIAAISKLTPESSTGQRANSAVRFVQPGCVVPQARSDEKLALFGVYEGTAVSSVTILGQDKPTSAAEVFIKEGKEPLYVVLTSYDPIVWKFLGATSRVRTVVLYSAVGSNTGITGSGLTGLDKSRVSFVAGRNCLGYFHRTGDLKEAKVKAQVRDLTGAEPDYVLGHYKVGFVTLPDGPVEKLTRNHQPPARSKLNFGLLRFAPSGLMKFDASTIVSQQPANDYEVLPQEAGLAQLLDEKKIERIGRGTYKIKQKIHIPAGLAGAHSVKFLLPKGVPAPIGSPGHSCVFSEATGRAIGRPEFCR